MASDDAESVPAAALEILAVVILFVLLDRGWPPWGAGPAAPDPSTAVLAIAIGAVAGILTLALVFRVDRPLVAGVAVVTPMAVLWEVAVRFVLELERAGAVRELLYFGYTLTATVIPIALAFAFDSSDDA